MTRRFTPTARGWYFGQTEGIKSLSSGPTYLRQMGGIVEQMEDAVRPTSYQLHDHRVVRILNVVPADVLLHVVPLLQLEDAPIEEEL
ncbi:unnamed protein product [Protopolystoma xenopodis]|uniref:Uncharacterized protein n=1 Tax=Protopolystoma xenopodis TaxID=117903 RepID=A0A3S5C2J9_9PLAT|nr:unnamed protein product [Protopolystoma xenopodis]